MALVLCASSLPAVGAVPWTKGSGALLAGLEPVALASASPTLATWAANFSLFNPSLLPLGGEAGRDGAALVFFRVSNMHFCRDGSWRDRLAQQTHLRSYLGAATLDTQSLTVSNPLVLRAATELFRTEGTECAASTWVPAGGGMSGTFSGPEDPRAFWSPGPSPRAPWLLTSVWSRDCTALRMHLIKFHPRIQFAAADEQPTSQLTAPPPVELPLVVADWPDNAPLPHPMSEPIQKNWAPFVHDGRLYAEYSIEPHVVLLIDPANGRCVPVSRSRSPDEVDSCSADDAAGRTEAAAEAGGAFSSFAPLARLSASHGRVSGGVPPLHLPVQHAYLGLAHLKASRELPHFLGTSQMPYKHLFYAFADTPPFRIIAAGRPFVMPEPALADRTPTVQFAAGMSLGSGGDDLLVSYSVRDCGARVARVRLDEVLRDVGLEW